MHRALSLIWLAFSLGWLALATLAAAAEPTRMALRVGELDREALVFAPDSAQQRPTPLVFGFHGHGGNSRTASRSFRLHEVWSEAIVVYPQGVPTPGKLSDPEGRRNGWQHRAGEQEDRDLKFFDVLLERLRRDYQVDPSRVYATGHSNGGAFTYVLWSARPNVFAAFAPSAAVLRGAPSLPPKPALHIAGEQDRVVRFAMQQRMIASLRNTNGCETEGRDLAPQCTLYPSSKDAPLVTLIHPGDHAYPAQAPALIVKFFQEHPGP